MTAALTEQRGVRGYWPLLAAIAVLASLLAALLVQSIGRNDGHFIYALDDPYIHMAMAKTLARAGVWGVTPHGFTSSSSSLLWTLILSAVYAAGGVRELIPLVLNIAFAVLLLIAIFQITRQYQLRAWLTAVLLCAIVLLTPLPTLILEGLEHVLQILIDLAFVSYAVRALSDDREAPATTTTGLVLLSPLVTAVRYEGAFLVLIVGLLLFAKRGLKDASLVAIAGLLPLVIFGVFSLAHGWGFVPNSVVLKAQWIGGLPNVSSTKQLLSASMRAAKVLLETPHLFVLLIASLALLSLQLRRDSMWRSSALWNLIFSALCLLHLQFAGTGWFYRYESYLVAMGLITLAITMPHIAWPRETADTSDPSARIPAALATAALTGLMLFPLISRAASALVDTPIATSNIYQQQYQMAQFVRASYAHTPVAANDIGAITFLNDGPILDLAGLASREVGVAVRAREYNAAVMQRLAREQGVAIAIMYDKWFIDGGIPSEWHKVGQWKIPERVAAAGDTISFYSVAADAEQLLIANLRAFSPRLPKAVVQKGTYTEMP